MSIEALAMAGADYTECGFDLQDWESAGGSLHPPPYLLVEKMPVAEAGTNCNDKKKANEERVKGRIREWAKAVAAVNKSLIQSELRNERRVLIKYSCYSTL